MCRTVHALLSTVICGIQMVVRVVMTTFLMMENILRMVLQTLYNFISFMLQLVALVPICCVFLLSTRMKCFMCGGGGPCPVNRGGACDCLMSVFAVIVLFLIFRATGVLDKIFYTIGYTKATTHHIIRFIPTTGSISECSRNGTDEEYIFYPLETTTALQHYYYADVSESRKNIGRSATNSSQEMLNIEETNSQVEFHIQNSSIENSGKNMKIEEKGEETKAYTIEEIKLDLKTSRKHTNSSKVTTKPRNYRRTFTKYFNDTHVVYYYL